MKIVDIEFKDDMDPEFREVLVTLDNGTVVRIGSCYESWEQWGGCTEELQETVEVADMVNEWLHDPDADVPAEVYSLVEGLF